MYTTEWFVPTRLGEYHLFCDQYCGAKHAEMVGTVVVCTPADYERWLAGDLSAEPPALAGKKLFTLYGCNTCHGQYGPTLAGLYGRPVDVIDEHGNRRTVIADEAYLRESILYPDVKLVVGLSQPNAQLQINAQRRADSRSDRIHQIAQRRSPDRAVCRPAARAGDAAERCRAADRKSAVLPITGPTNDRGEPMASIPYIPEYAIRETYLNSRYSIASWLLTKDHKRIAVLYMISITLFFAVGGAAAVIMRLQLLTPHSTLVEAETYNKLFTLHGIMMVFFFLVPSIPATLGNFLVPLMIGARDLAFPRINLLSWYLFIIGGIARTDCPDPRRRRYRLDVLHALQQHLQQYPRGAGHHAAFSSPGSARSSPG